MNANPINWRATLLEAFFLVSGVVLAMAAGNWRENHNNKLRADIALESIMEELNANHASVTLAIGYHGHLLDTLYRYMGRHIQEAESFPGMEMFSKGFINPASLLSGAWDAATATGIIEFMPYEKVLRISQVYKRQELYEAQSRSVGQLIYQRMFDEGTMGIVQNYRNLTQIIGSVAYTECGLARAYVEVLPELKEKMYAPETDSVVISIPQFCQYIPQR